MYKKKLILCLITFSIITATGSTFAFVDNTGHCMSINGDGDGTFEKCISTNGCLGCLNQLEGLEKKAVRLAKGFCSASVIFSPLVAVCLTEGADVSYCKKAIDDVTTKCAHTDKTRRSTFKR